uniref:Kazrin n=1 Tax=Phallusia mammillata TaxID=59560 RepID=A0A6F9DGF3_9ASCI|nr:kazrin [Phallusia mammillata]
MTSCLLMESTYRSTPKRSVSFADTVTVISTRKAQQVANVPDKSESAESEEQPPNDRHEVSFVSAYTSKFGAVETALQSLDSLSEQILQFIFSSSLNSTNRKNVSDLTNSVLDHSALLPQQRDALHASLTLMRGLLMDAQTKFKKMVDNNKRLATHIDGTIQSANHEVNTLRVELNMTNQKLRELSVVKDVCAHCQETREMNKVMEDNKALSSSNRQLLKEIANLKQQISNSEIRNKDSLQALQSERQRLKQDKTELLNQIHEMQKTIEDKEEQLRDFIREFELQMKESEDIMKEGDDERSRLSRERNDISRRHQDLTEVVSSLRNELVCNERKIKELESELQAVRQSAVQVQSSKRRSMHVSVEESFTNHKSINLPGTEPNTSSHSQDPLLIPTPSPVSPRHCFGQVPGGTHSSSSEDVQIDPISNGGSLGPSYARKNKLVQHLSGSLSRAFKRGRNRKSLDIRPETPLFYPRNASFSVSSLSSDADVFLASSHLDLYERSDEEKKEILENNQNLPMYKWKADAVLVWLELVMHMSQYVRGCAENIKSGKVLLGLSDAELDNCLNIENPLHRRKICLAIDEFRNPSVTIANMSAAGQLDHWWVSEQWLRDIGLTQYASRFREHLIDGRTLASLSRKDLERHLGMEGKKCHLESALRGIQLLHMLGFNIQRLDERRQMCQSTDTDLLVWNNSRLIQWAKSIDLKEYSSNLRDSGVHGAMAVFDPNFTSDDMASALGIPVNKATVRRHLASEFETVVASARESLEEEVMGPKEETGKKSSPFVRSNHQQKSKRSIRSSISRSLGRQMSKDTQLNGK